MALDPTQWDEACRRRQAGESIAALARAFGISASTLGKAFAAHRIAPKPAKAAPARKAGKAAAAKSKTTPSKTRAPPARAPRIPAASVVRRQLIGRLYRAIDTKLKLMERRMNSEIDHLDAAASSAVPADDGGANAGRSSADHERETRAFGALVKTINSVRQMQAEIDTIANAPAAANAKPSAADARLAADAERYRRDIAERLAKFVPPGT
jgi:transposase-like protein